MPRNSETTTKFKVDISELKRSMQDAKRQIAIANSEFKAVSSSMDDWASSSEGVSAKLKQLDSNLKSQEKILSDLERQYELVVQEQGEGSAAADKLKIAINNQKTAINKTKSEIKKYDSVLNDLESGAGDAGDSVKDAGREAEDSSEGWTVLKDVLADLVKEGISKAIDAFKTLATDGSNAYSQFAAQTGIATEAMGEYEDAIKSIYKNNFGESLEDVAEKMGKVKEVTGELDASKLQDMTEKAITLEDTFGMDMTETLRGVKSLMDHFGLSSEEAFDLIASGAQNGLNYTDELGDNVSEYAGKFAEAGYSSDEYFQLLKNGADGGAYNLDKVNDAINEVTTRLADGTIEKNLDSFDKNTQKTFKAWQDGEATQKDVVDAIVKNIQNTKGEQDKMNLSAAAFGTMAEDGGTKFIESLGSVGDSFTDVKGKADELANVKYDNVESAISGFGRTLNDSLIQPVADTLAPVITDLFNFLTEHINIVAPLVLGLATAFTILAGALAISGIIAGVSTAMGILNATLLANPIVLIVALIAGLVVALVMLWKKSDAFRNFWKNLWANIQSVGGKAINAIIGFFKNLPTKAKEQLNKVVTSVSSWGTQLASKGKAAAGKLVNAARDKMKELVGKVKSIGGDVAKGLWSGITDKVGWLKDKISGFVGDVKGWLKKFFKIGSPSKLMRDEIGKWIPAGIAMGIDDNAKTVLQSAKDLTVGAVAAARDGMVTGSAFSSGKSVTGGVVNNFYQTNNSPKALSRLEIYRQSKNLLGYAGGV